jgi:dolichyl-phosphate beta-glucosyltransferase
MKFLSFGNFMFEFVLSLILLLISLQLLWPYWVWRRSGGFLQNSTLFTARLFKPASIYLSVVVPAFNEAERLPKMLQATLAYLKQRKFSYEVIVVDDGSTDKTSEVAMLFSDVQVVKLARNQGKGAAVKTGVLHSLGEQILMVDADAATEISDLEKLQLVMDQKMTSVVFGSRAHLEASDAVARRSALRNFLMKCFHLCVSLFVGSNVQDTQCGFKLFKRQAAQLLFPSLHLCRWAFDIELVELCRRLNFRISEVPVNWQEIPGSKLHVISASFQMLRDMASVRFCYSVGLWNPIISKSC